MDVRHRARRVVNGLDGKPLIAADTAKMPVLRPPGGGSDHMTFIYMLGIPGTTTGYYGPFGAHHTAEDNIAGIQTYDPGYQRVGHHLAVHRRSGDAHRGRADARPIRISEVPALMLRDLATLQADPVVKGVDVTALRTKLTPSCAAAAAIDEKMIAAERSGDVATMDALQVKIAEARDAFYAAGRPVVQPLLAHDRPARRCRTRKSTTPPTRPTTASHKMNAAVDAASATPSTRRPRRYGDARLHFDRPDVGRAPATAKRRALDAEE